MNRKKYQLSITLKSDLCMGSGYAYAGVIDSDVCYDSCGLPYIPSRRLKGCLREAAELVLQPLESEDGGKKKQKQEINNLFGDAGQDGVKGLIIDDAHLENYSEMHAELENLKEEYRAYITPQKVLDEFTTVKAQTKIGKNGVAADNSLRFTRTVNHFAPGNGGADDAREMCFISSVSIEEDNEEADRLLHAAVRALRHIGINRNRGLGSVKCTLAPAAEDKKTVINTDVVDAEDDIYVLRYRVRSMSPLIISTNNDSRTEKYIGGRSVLGSFAGAYLRTGKSADTEEFEELFLKNKVHFSALYPADEKVFYPAPSYINRLKKTKKYVNVSSSSLPVSESECRENGHPVEYATGSGNQPKKLKGLFVSLEDGGITVKEPETDIVYHHSKKSGKQNARDGQLLYTAEVLREQQTFAGEIRGCGRDIRILASLMSDGTFRFGKSRSAQYGLCMLEGTPVIEKADREEIVYRAGERIMVVFQSDAVFQNDNGYTVRLRDVREQVRQQLGICEKEGEKTYTELEAGELTGYYSKWNLKRAAVPVVKAGSSLEYCLAQDLRVNKDAQYLGECTGEGFGRIAVLRNIQNDFRIEEAPRSDRRVSEPKAAAKLCRGILLAEAKERLMRKAVSVKSGFKNPAALGRVTLMLTDSIRSYPADVQEQYRDFRSRIQAIKTDDTKKCAERLLSAQICPDEELEPGNLRYLGEDMEELRELYDSLCGGKAGFARRMADIWSEYLMAVLVQEKYNLKKREERL